MKGRCRDQRMVSRAFPRSACAFCTGSKRQQGEWPAHPCWNANRGRGSCWGSPSAVTEQDWGEGATAGRPRSSLLHDRLSARHTEKESVSSRTRLFLSTISFWAGLSARYGSSTESSSVHFAPGDTNHAQRNVMAER